MRHLRADDEFVTKVPYGTWSADEPFKALLPAYPPCMTTAVGTSKVPKHADERHDRDPHAGSAELLTCQPVQMECR